MIPDTKSLTKSKKTNIDYVNDIGDVCRGLKRRLAACGEGAVAATSAFTDIKQN